jgi:hypothetical protein
MVVVVVVWVYCFVCFGFVFREFAQQYYAQQVWKCLIELCCRGCIRSVCFEQWRSLQIHVNHSRCHLVFMPCRSTYPPAALQRSGVVTWIPLFVIPWRSWSRGATVSLPFRVRGRQKGFWTREYVGKAGEWIVAREAVQVSGVALRRDTLRGWQRGRDLWGNMNNGSVFEIG